MISPDIYKKYAEVIEQELSQLPLPERPASLYEPVRYTLALGGKRIRPYFTLMACGLCGGDVEEAIPAAAAIELLHNFTLLHDDIMDAAPTRRGKESVYKKWNPSIAILSGDAMYAWAFEQLQYYGENKRFTKEQYFEIISIFIDSAKLVCEGQAYDLDFEKERETGIETYLKMIRGKTAALIAGSFKMGAQVAGAGEQELRLLGETGEQIGIGFQIQDDLLDVSADPKQFGKKKAGDILERKKTYLFTLALQKCDEKQKAELLSIYEKIDLTAQDVEKVLAIYKQQNILKTAHEAVNYYYEQGIQSVKTFSNSSFKTELIEFIISLKNRKY